MKAKKKSPIHKKMKPMAKAKTRQVAKKKKIQAAKKSEVVEDAVEEKSKYQYPGETHSSEQMVNPNLRMRRRNTLR